jgi:hypothetical protein
MMPPYVETWKAIARMLGRSERWCRYMTRVPDPLPVYKVGGIVRINEADLGVWLARQRERTLPGGPQHGAVVEFRPVHELIIES